MTSERHSQPEPAAPPLGAAIRIRPFAPTDQAAARQLILTGLGEHFGFIDETLNPDLEDIHTAYSLRGDCFVVAVIAEEVVGTGALIVEEPGIGRLVRMSTSAHHRRRGIGRALVAHLIEAGRTRGLRRLVIETNDDWNDAIGLYLATGFTEIARGDGSVHLARDLG